MTQQKTTASWWVLVIVALLIGAIVGYYLGSKGVGTGLIEEDAASEEGATVETGGSVEGETEAPANPFDDGYQNPFE